MQRNPMRGREGAAQGGLSPKGEGFWLVRIFTQSRRVAENLIGKNDSVLREIEIFGGPHFA